jgi:hypothetical protein
LPEIFPGCSAEEEQRPRVPDGVSDDVSGAVQATSKGIGSPNGGPLLPQGSVEAAPDMPLTKENFQALLGGSGSDQSPEEIQVMFLGQLRRRRGIALRGPVFGSRG